MLTKFPGAVKRSFIQKMFLKTAVQESTSGKVKTRPTNF